MAFVDWSDSEGMLDLFQEFVRDEMNNSLADTGRQRFLKDLLGHVRSIREGRIVDAIQELKAIQESIEGDFSADPVSLHLADLINELERLT